MDLCGGAVGATTISGPQGSFKARGDGTYNLLQSKWSSSNLSMQGTFQGNELRNVKLTVGGGEGQPGDQIEFTNDGKVFVNGEEVKGEITTANGTKISKNGDSVVIKTPDGDSFKMSTTACRPPAINVEGEISPQRAQGDVSGLVGTFDDSIPGGQFADGPGGTRGGDPGTPEYWASWALKQVSKANDEDEKRRQEASAAAQRSAQKGAEQKAAGPKPADTGTTRTGEAPQPGDGPKPTTDGPATGGPTTGTPIATPTPVAVK